MLTKISRYRAELQPYRSERLRCKNYTYGNQWKDIVTDESGRRLTEEQYIREQGSAPLKNNLIRKIIRNVLGVFRHNYALPTFTDLRGSLPASVAADPRLMESLSRRFAATADENYLPELFSRVLEEYLIGGLAVVRKHFSPEEGGKVRTVMVRPDDFFFNTDASDPRGWDIDFIGQVYRLDDESAAAAATSVVYEVWRNEDAGWRYYFLDDNGRVLLSDDSPFPSGGHPYVMKAYPFIDGEIHSFVADCIDQQRYINRLITLNDWIIRASAKGVLLFPENAIPEDLDLEDIAAQWSRYNGVIRYKARTGTPEPRQVSTNSTNVGISELLSVQLKMMEDVSGINAALQGQLNNGSVSGTLYEQQTRHALTGLADIMEGFRAFMKESGLKDIDLLRLAV